MTKEADMNITMQGKYRTRGWQDEKNSQTVKILCVDGPCPNYPVVGYIGDEPKPDTWTADGKIFMGLDRADYSSNPLDLIPVFTKREGWGCMRMRSMTPETVCIADGLVFTTEDEARKYGNEMLTDGYVIAYVTWKGDSIV